MGSNQNPIHRDRGKREVGGQSFEDSKQAVRQNEVEIEQHAPLAEDQNAPKSEEEQKRQASERLAEVQRDIEDEK